MDKKALVLFLLVAMFAVPAVSAYPIYVTPLNSSDDLTPNSSYAYEFNFTTDSGCTNSLLSNYSIIVTDKYGVGFVDLDTSSLSARPSYLCEYRNGSLRATHTIPDHIANDLFAEDLVGIDSIELNGVTITDWSNVNLTSGLDTLWPLSPLQYYLYNSSGNLTYNETKLNATIDARSGGSGIWVNDSGIAQYFGSANVTGNITAGENICTESGECFNKKNVVTVCSQGCEYTGIQNAIDSISDATNTNRYVVFVYPGLYIGNIVMEDYVDLVGMSRENTIIMATSGTLIDMGTTNSSGLKHLTLMHSLGALAAPTRTIDITSGTHILKDVIVDVSKTGGDNVMTAIEADSGILHMTAVIIKYTISGNTAAVARTQHVIEWAGSATDEFYFLGSSIDANINDTNDAVFGIEMTAGGKDTVLVDGSFIDIYNEGDGLTSGLYLSGNARGLTVSNCRWQIKGNQTVYGGYVDSIAGTAEAWTFGNDIITNSTQNVAAYAGYIDAGDTWNSFFDYIEATNGSAGTGTINMASSAQKGTITTTGTGYFSGVGSFLMKVANGFFSYLFAENLNVTGNITLNGVQIDSWDNVNVTDPNSFWPLATQNYLYNNTGSLDYNESKLNNTIGSYFTGKLLWDNVSDVAFYNGSVRVGNSSFYINNSNERVGVGVIDGEITDPWDWSVAPRIFKLLQTTGDAILNVVSDSARSIIYLGGGSSTDSYIVYDNGDMQYSVGIDDTTDKFTFSGSNIIINNTLYRVNTTVFDATPITMVHAGGYNSNTSEVWTGEYWIDGNKIYRKVVTFVGNINNDEQYVNITSPATEAVTGDLIRLDAVGKRGTRTFALPLGDTHTAGDERYAAVYLENSTTITFDTKSNWIGAEITAILEYTK